MNVPLVPRDPSSHRSERRDGKGWIALVRWGVAGFGILVAVGVGFFGDRPDWRKSLLVVLFVAAYLGLWSVAMARVARRRSVAERQ